MRPIVVVGTGRCGTSTVAKGLIDRGVFVGGYLMEGGPGNPDGHFEDLEFVMPNEARLRGWASLEDWKAMVLGVIDDRRRWHKFSWGFKDPRVAELIEDYHLLMEPLDPIWVWCWRPLEDVVFSMMTTYGERKDVARALVERRLEKLDHLRELSEKSRVMIEFEDIVSGAYGEQLDSIVKMARGE